MGAPFCASKYASRSLEFKTKTTGSDAVTKSYPVHIRGPINEKS